MMLKRYLQLLLAAFLIEPSAVPTNPEAGDDFHYVSIGASQTAGYGLRGFLPEEFYIDKQSMWSGNRNGVWGYYSDGYNFHPDNAYPELIGDALQEKFGDSVNVFVDHCEMNAMRARDLDLLLNPEKEKDNYYTFMIKSWVESNNAARNDTITVKGVDYTHVKEETDMRTEIIDRIANADLISYDLGVNDFGGYLLNVAYGGWFGNDLHKLIPAEYADYYYEVEGYLKNQLISYVGEDVNSALLDKLDLLVNTIAYAFVGFCTSFDATMKTIYELNPDVEVVVVEIQNIYKDLTLDVLGYDIPAGDIFGAIVDMANAYTAYVSDYANNYYIADFGDDQRVEYFVDEIVNWDGTLTSLRLMSDFIDSMDIYQSNLAVESTVKAEIAPEYNSLYHTDLTYDELYRDFSSRPAFNSVALWMQRELTYKSEITYYTVAKAFNMSLSTLKMPLISGEVSGSSVFTKVMKVAKDVRANWLEEYGENVEEAEIFLYNNAIPAIDTKLNALLGEAEKQALVAYCYQAGYALSFELHPTPNGHAKTAEKIFAAYEAKQNVRQNAAQAITDIVDAIPDITKEDCINAIAAFADRIIRIANEEEEAIAQTRAELAQLMDYVKVFLDNADVYINEAKSVLESIYVALDEVGLVDVLADDVEAALIAMGEMIDNAIVKVENAVEVARDYVEMTIEEIRAIVPVVADAIETMVDVVNDIVLALPGIIEDVQDALTQAYINYEATKAVVIEATINTIITVKKTIDAVTAFVNTAYDIINKINDACVYAYNVVIDTIDTINTILNSDVYNNLKVAIDNTKAMLSDIANFVQVAAPYVADCGGLVADIANMIGDEIDIDVLNNVVDTLINSSEKVANAAAIARSVADQASALLAGISSAVNVDEIIAIVNEAQEIMAPVMPVIAAAAGIIEDTAIFAVASMPNVAIAVTNILNGMVGFYDANNADIYANILATINVIYNVLDFAKQFTAVSIEVIHVIEDVVDHIIDKIMEINAFINRIENMINAVIAAYYSIPEPIRNIIERAVSNVVNQCIYDFNLLGSQIKGVIDHSIYAPISEAKEIISKFVNMYITIPATIANGVNEAVASVLGNANDVVITIVTDADDIVVTITGCVIDNITNIVEACENGDDAIVEAINEELNKTVEPDTVQREDEIVEAYNEMLDALDESINNGSDALIESGMNIVEKLQDLFAAWKLA